jgi:hypothetical protein
MKMNINYIWLITLLLLGCNSKERDCDVSEFRELNLYPVNVILKIPKYKFVDSIVYNKETIINYKVMTLDSSLTLIAFVDSYEKDTNSLVSINQIMIFQKEQVEAGMDSIKLLEDTIVNRNNIDLGFIKYFVQQENKKYYESRVAFYRERVLVKLWLFEKYDDKIKNTGSIMDCIFDNMTFK